MTIKLFEKHIIPTIPDIPVFRVQWEGGNWQNLWVKRHFGRWCIPSRLNKRNEHPCLRLNPKEIDQLEEAYQNDNNTS